MNNIDKLLGELKNQLFSTRPSIVLKSKIVNWIIINSALDVIEDNNCAVIAYLKYKDKSSCLDYPEYCGELYLIIYGVMQSLFVQQEAVIKLIDALTNGLLKKPKDNETTKDTIVNAALTDFSTDIAQRLETPLKSYRDNIRSFKVIRNYSTGHPTDGDYGKTFTWLIRSSMSKSGFELITESSLYGRSTKIINVLEEINKHNKATEKLLQAVVKALKEEETEHLKKYRSQKMHEIFDYPRDLFVDVAEAINDPKEHKINLARTSLLTLDEQISEFKKQCMERGDIVVDAWKQEFDVIDNISKKLREYFNSSSVQLKQLDLLSYIDSLKVRLHTIHEFAKDIDNKYATLEISG